MQEPLHYRYIMARCNYEYKSEQLLSTGLKSRTLFTTGVVVEKTINNFYFTCYWNLRDQ